MGGTVELNGITLPLLRSAHIIDFVGKAHEAGHGVGVDGFVKDVLPRTHLVDSPGVLPAGQAHIPARATDGSLLHGAAGRFPTKMNAAAQRMYLYNVLRFSGPEMTKVPAQRAPTHEAVDSAIRSGRIALNMYGQARYYHAGATGILDDPEFYIQTLTADARHLFPDAQWQ